MSRLANESPPSRPREPESGGPPPRTGGSDAADSTTSPSISLVVGGAVVVLLVVILFLFFFIDSTRGPRGSGGANSDLATSSSRQGGTARNDEQIGTDDRDAGLGKEESEETSQPSSERATSDQPALQVRSPLDSETTVDSLPGTETNANNNSPDDLRDSAESKNDKPLVTNQFFTLGAPTTEGIPQDEESDSEPSVGDTTETAQFFGLRADANKIVFVIDMSSSMSGLRFEAARQELVKSIKRLKRQQSFFVVFFNDAPLPQPKDTMQKASPGNKKGIRRWIAKVSPFGGTQPTAAILHALDCTGSA